jgi:hypothetical protein
MPQVCGKCGDFRIGEEPVCETCGASEWRDLSDVRRSDRAPRAQPRGSAGHTTRYVVWGLIGGVLGALVAGSLMLAIGVVLDPLMGYGPGMILMGLIFCSVPVGAIIGAAMAVHLVGRTSSTGGM